MAAVDPGCTGERTLLLGPDEDVIREVYNDVALQSLLSKGWIDVTGLEEFEEHCTRIRAEGSQKT